VEVAGVGVRAVGVDGQMREAADRYAAVESDVAGVQVDPGQRRGVRRRLRSGHLAGAGDLLDLREAGRLLGLLGEQVLRDRILCGHRMLRPDVGPMWTVASLGGRRGRLTDPDGTGRPPDVRW